MLLVLSCLSLVFFHFVCSHYFLFIFSLFLCISLFSSPYFYSYSILRSFFYDDISLFMTFMLVCVVFLSSFWVFQFYSSALIIFLLTSITALCCVVFRSCRLLTLYISYEISLLPIILIIIIWGSYPERSLRSIILLLYTSVFTMPFILVLFYVLDYYQTFSFVFFDYSLSKVFSFLVFGVFAVKLPVYGLHFWLPIAHVEAPTFGSMILAGVLLKLGGVGLLRCYLLINWFFISECVLSYFVIFLIYVTLVCCFQPDFKRLVAYSSVSHMIVIPLLLMCHTAIGYKSVVLVLLFHGFSSPLLFSLVGYSYSIYRTRQLFSIRGVLLSSPVLSLLFVIGFMFSLCMPPFPSYVSEVIFFISSINLWSFMPVALAFFSFISLIYNLNWLSCCLFSLSSHNVSYSSFYLPFVYLYPMLMFVLIGLVFIPLFSFV